MSLEYTLPHHRIRQKKFARLRLYVIRDESIVLDGYQSETSRENRFKMVCREQRSNCDVAFFDAGQLEKIENA